MERGLKKKTQTFAHNLLNIFIYPPIVNMGENPKLGFGFSPGEFSRSENSRAAFFAWGVFAERKLQGGLLRGEDAGAAFRGAKTPGRPFAGRRRRGGLFRLGSFRGAKTPGRLFSPGEFSRSEDAGASTFTFFNTKIPLKLDYFEEAIHRKVAEGEEVPVQSFVFLFLLRLVRLGGKKFFSFLAASRYLNVNAGAL
jgi:hypothetical protein